jgi:hypothetical protein
MGIMRKNQGSTQAIAGTLQRNLSGEELLRGDGKIRSIQLPSIRYFAYFITKCVLARKVASKLSSHDLAFLATALKQDKEYNFGALIASRLTINREKGGVCGGLIASRLLAFHGLVPHALDFQFPLEMLDLNSMMQHQFVSYQANIGYLPYEITFFKRKSLSRWVTKTDCLVNLHAPLLLNLDAREGWSLTEQELDTYIEEQGRHVQDDGGEAEDNFVQPSDDTAGFPYQQPDYDHVPYASSSSRGPGYDYARDDPQSWSHYSAWG